VTHHRKRILEELAALQFWGASFPVNHNYASGSLCERRPSELGSPSDSASWAGIAGWCNLKRGKHPCIRGANPRSGTTNLPRY
jgi:hypothetical protein